MLPLTSPAPGLEEVGWDQEADGFVCLNWRAVAGALLEDATVTKRNVSMQLE